MMRWFLRLMAVVVVLAAAGAAVVLSRRGRPAPLPAGLAGTLVYVSDRGGVDALYLRRLPGGPERVLVSLAGPVGEPALSPDGKRVAFASGGRIGIVTVATGELRFPTPGTEWLDASPSWTPDGGSLVVSSRRRDQVRSDVHLLRIAEASEPERRPLTRTVGLDETYPVVSPDGAFVVFEREEGLVRLDLKDGRSRRLTTGFRKLRRPCFLPAGTIACLWTEGKRFGIEVVDGEGRERRTLSEGSVCYRSLAPSPDGKFLAATFVFDMGFHPVDALRQRQTEEVRLLDGVGTPVGVLAASPRDSNHSPSWGR
jgi:Tol biopolymer transport system component